MNEKPNPFATLLAPLRVGVDDAGFMVPFNDGPYLEYADVLAALAAAYPADLAEAGEFVERLRDDGLIATRAESADLITALLARIAAQEAQIKGLQRTYDDLYSDALADAKSDAQDFESDLWKMVRAYLDELHFDWRDFMEDGVTADEAVSHIRECMNEETRRAETALAASEARVAKLVEALETLEKAASEVPRRSVEDGLKWSNLTVAIMQARAAITEATQ